MSEPEPRLDPQTIELLDKQVNRYQAIVARLSGVGVQVKTWCVTAVGAVSALAVNNDAQGLFAVALGVLAVFFFLDAYYLGLERRFRAAATNLVERVEAGEQQAEEQVDLRPFFLVEPAGGAHGIGAAGSRAIWPFYTVVAGLLVVGLFTV